MASGGYASEDHRKAMRTAGALPGTAITQTYSTTATTVAAATTSPPSALVLTATNIAAKTPSGTLTDAVNTNAASVATSLDQAQADLGTKINQLRTDLIAAEADILADKKIINIIIDALQAYGILS